MRTTMRLLGRAAGYLALAVTGSAVATCGAFYQAWTWHALPVGLVLSLVTGLVVFVGGAQLLRDRLGALVPVCAWFLTVISLAVPRPEGDVVLSVRWEAYAYLFVGSIFGAVVFGLSLTWNRVLTDEVR